MKSEMLLFQSMTPEPQFEDKIVAAIKWVDGTVIDVVRKIKTI